MKRTDISEIFPEATKEQIDKLMGINGADINSAKGDLDAIKGQLTAAQQEITQLKTAGQPDQLQAATASINALKAELDGMKQAESLRQMRDKVAADKKIPVNLLTGETEEACAAQADSILAFAKSNGYPNIPDGGEIHNTPAPKARDKFAEWAAEIL